MKPQFVMADGEPQPKLSWREKEKRNMLMKEPEKDSLNWIN